MHRPCNYEPIGLLLRYGWVVRSLRFSVPPQVFDPKYASSMVTLRGIDLCHVSLHAYALLIIIICVSDLTDSGQGCPSAPQPSTVDLYRNALNNRYY